MFPTAHEVEETLQILGDTPDEIALTLANKGISLKMPETQSISFGCPIAQFLNREFPDTRASVGILSVYMDDGSALNSLIIKVPVEIKDFIRRFDDKRYNLDGTVSVKT